LHVRLFYELRDISTSYGRFLTVSGTSKSFAYRESLLLVEE
jgi:hypothetical protein